MTLGSKIQQLRKQKGLSQEELAAKLSVSRQAVSKWELDIATPDPTNIVNLSNLFSVSCDFLLREKMDFSSVHKESTKKSIPSFLKEKFPLLFFILGTSVFLIIFLLSCNISVPLSTRNFFSAGIITSVEYYPDTTSNDFFSFIRFYDLQFIICFAFLFFILGIFLLFKKDKKKFSFFFSVKFPTVLFFIGFLGCLILLLLDQKAALSMPNCTGDLFLIFLFIIFFSLILFCIFLIKHRHEVGIKNKTKGGYHDL